MNPIDDNLNKDLLFNTKTGRNQMLKQNNICWTNLIKEGKLLKIFGFLFFAAATCNISIEKIAEYPIFPKPPCLYHPDRSIYQSDTSAVFDYLINDKKYLFFFKFDDSLKSSQVNFFST